MLSANQQAAELALELYSDCVRWLLLVGGGYECQVGHVECTLAGVRGLYIRPKHLWAIGHTSILPRGLAAFRDNHPDQLARVPYRRTFWLECTGAEHLDGFV